MTTPPCHPDLLILQGTCAGHPANILVDSGASMDFINHRYMAKHRLPKTKEDPHGRVTLVDGSVRPCTQISDNTVTLSGYQTSCHLHVTDLGPHDLILGQPWLQSNNPDIDWAQRTLRPRIQGPERPTQIIVAPSSEAPRTTSSKDIPVISSLQASRALRHGASGYLALVRTAETTTAETTTAETTTMTPAPGSQGRLENLSMSWTAASARHEEKHISCRHRSHVQTSPGLSAEPPHAALARPSGCCLSRSWAMLGVSEMHLRLQGELP